VAIASSGAEQACPWASLAHADPLKPHDKERIGAVEQELEASRDNPAWQ